MIAKSSGTSLLLAAALVAAFGLAARAQAVPPPLPGAGPGGACAIRKYGNAPAHAQAYIRLWEAQHASAAQGWTFDPRAVQLATRRHPAAQAVFGAGPGGRTALYFLPAAPAILEDGEAVAYTEQTGTGIDGDHTATGTFGFASGAMALRAAEAYRASEAAPYHGFFLHPGIVNALTAQPLVKLARVYFCDDPERRGDAAGVIIVGVDTAGNEMWGLRSFYQDGSTLVPQQCGPLDEPGGVEAREPRRRRED